MAVVVHVDHDDAMVIHARVVHANDYQQGDQGVG